LTAKAKEEFVMAGSISFGLLEKSLIAVGATVSWIGVMYMCASFGILVAAVYIFLGAFILGSLIGFFHECNSGKEEEPSQADETED